VTVPYRVWSMAACW